MRITKMAKRTRQEQKAASQREATETIIATATAFAEEIREE